MTVGEVTEVGRGVWRWVLLAAVVGALPLANALIGIPYLRANIPGHDVAWFVHRALLISAHVGLVAVIILWARSAGFDLRAREHAWIGVAVVGVCIVLVSLAASQKQLVPLADVADAGSFSRWAQVVSISSILWAGIGQEILFRSFALPVVAGVTGSTALALVVTSATFAYYHGGLSFGAGNLLANFAGGFLLGLVFVHTGSLWAAAVPHALLITVLLMLA